LEYLLGGDGWYHHLCLVLWRFLSTGFDTQVTVFTIYPNIENHLKKLSNTICFCIFFLLSLNAHAADFPLLKITKNNNSSFLIGSIHAGPIPFQDDPRLNSIISQSRTICMEVDPSDIANARLAKEKIILNPKGIHLKDRLGVDLYEEIKSRLSPDPISLYSPFAIGAKLFDTLPLLHQMNMDYQAVNSIENYIKNTAAKYHIPITAIEDKQAVVNAFANISDQEWQQYLHSILKIIDCSECVMKYAENLTIAYSFSKTPENAYRHGVLAMSSEPDMVSIFEKMNYGDRNINMANNIESDAIDKGLCDIVVVGAGHLGGEKGLVNLLKTKGLKVEAQ
jgi:uncharacterized protein YbaP (TraB family)